LLGKWSLVLRKWLLVRIAGRGDYVPEKFAMEAGRFFLSGNNMSGHTYMALFK
jgi:hypothetical protein